MRENQRDTTGRGGLPIWGWGMIALGVVLVIGAAIFATVPRGQPLRTLLPGGTPTLVRQPSSRRARCGSAL